VGIFDYLIFRAEPGIANAEFIIYSNTIDTEYISSIYNPQNDPNIIINKQTIHFDFRLCIEGEALINGE
jgi:hypothetical protein